MYTSVKSESWSLFSTVVFRTAVLIFCIVSVMINALGMVGVMKYHHEWQLLYSVFLFFPILMSGFLYYYSKGIPDSTKMMYNVAAKSDNFLQERINIVSELSSKPGFDTICGGCNIDNFSNCIGCSVYYHRDLIEKGKAFSIFLSIGCVINFILHLGFYFLFEVDNTQYQKEK